jgi:hypothetical protein
MNNLSPITTFAILALNIIAISMEASPPEYTQIDDRTFVNLAKKTQEPQKASSPLTSLPRGPLRGGKFGRGHWLLVLAAIILTGTSYIFGNKKAE